MDGCDSFINMKVMSFKPIVASSNYVGTLPEYFALFMMQ